MDLPDLTFSIWCSPHRSWGYLVDILSVDDHALGFVQSQRDATNRDPRYPEIDFNSPHREFEVSAEDFLSLCREVEDVSYRFREPPLFERFGGTFFVLKVRWDYQEFMVKWHGRFEDQDAKIVNLYRRIQRLAGEDFPRPLGDRTPGLTGSESEILDQK